jgi:RNA polymerase sigma factor (TIGR02999 family)
MSEVTRLLNAIAHEDPQAAQELWPLVYQELRRLAARKLAREKPGQTLDATALVHEAYVRLVGPAEQTRWRNHCHFFSAAAEAMRRILVENARRKKLRKYGGDRRRVELNEDSIAAAQPPAEVLAIHEALDRLAAENVPSLWNAAETTAAERKRTSSHRGSTHAGSSPRFRSGAHGVGASCPLEGQRPHDPRPRQRPTNTIFDEVRSTGCLPMVHLLGVGDRSILEVEPRAQV